jgi:hypothetical protein
MARHFNYHENGGPFPGKCVACGNNKKLFNLARELPFQAGTALICHDCVRDLAEFIGFVNPLPLEEELEELSAQLVSRETEIKRIPDKLEEFINGVRDQFGNFIVAISSDSDDDQPEVVRDSEASASSSDRPRKTKNVDN